MDVAAIAGRGQPGSTGARWHIIMSGSMFVVAPVLAVFAVAQRHIVRAFTFTSLK